MPRVTWWGTRDTVQPHMDLQERIYHTAESLQVLINIFFFPNPQSLVTTTLPYFT